MSISESVKKVSMESYMAAILKECLLSVGSVKDGGDQVRKLFSERVNEQVGDFLFNFSDRSDYDTFMKQWNKGVALHVCRDTLYVTVLDFGSEEVIDQFFIDRAAIRMMKEIESLKDRILLMRAE